MSYAKKRALELETDIEVYPTRGATRTKPNRIPARKKARPAVKISDSKATAKATATPRGNTGVPPKIPPRTYRARKAPTSSPSTPPPNPPTKPETLSCGCRSPQPPRIPRRKKHVQDDDVAMGPTHKKLKTDCASPYKTSKRKPRQATNSGRPQRNTKARFTPSNCQPASYLPRPVKPGNLSASTEELVSGYHPAPTRGTPLAKGASITPLAKTMSSKKRTNENTIVKSAVTKRPRKEYFQEGMVLKYESGDDAEVMSEKLDTKEAQSITPFPAHTSTASSTAPTNMAKGKSPLTSILGKRTSTETQGFDAKYTSNKKGRKEYFQEGMALKHELDEEPITNGKDHQNCPRSKAFDYRILHPSSILRMEEEEIL